MPARTLLGRSLLENYSAVLNWPLSTILRLMHHYKSDLERTSKIDSFASSPDDRKKIDLFLVCSDGRKIPAHRKTSSSDLQSCSYCNLVTKLLIRGATWLKKYTSYGLPNDCHATFGSPWGLLGGSKNPFESQLDAS